MLFARRKKSSRKSQDFSRLRNFEALEARQLLASLAIDATQYESRNLLVQFTQPAEVGSVASQSQSRGVDRWSRLESTWDGIRQLSSDGWYSIQVPNGMDMQQAMQSLALRTDVAFATPDFRLYATATPNDPGLASTWGLSNSRSVGVDIGAKQAWDFGTSSSVVVAVIDSGIDYNHVDLAANIWRNTDEIAGNGRDDDGNGYVDDIRGWNFVSDNNNPMDDNGHGTHIAGTIGAVGNNATGVAGINWSIQMMPLKFLARDGSGLLSDAIAAIDYARVNGAKIINASWGGGGFSSALQSAIQRFQNAGGIFVAAAGNEGSNNAVVASYPANYNLTNIVSVASSTSTDGLSSFSNYGTNVDIAAPGSNIYSTLPGNRYGSMSGTSMATPHVAGAMALLWGQNPSVTARQLIDAVMQNTDDVLRGPTQHGRLDVGKAAAALRGSSATTGGNTNGSDTTMPSITQATWRYTGTNLTTVDLTFSEAIRATTLADRQMVIQGPAGRIGLISVTPLGSAGTQFRILFGPQSEIGTYSLQITPTVADLQGNRLDTDRDGIGGEVQQDIYLTTTQIQRPTIRDFAGPANTVLPDATRSSATVTTVPISVNGAFTVGSLELQLALSHTYVSDLRIRLIAPSGQAVTLFQRRGGSTDNLAVTFADDANLSVSQVSGSISGRFKGEQALSAFRGIQAQGTWQLEITDYAYYDAGTLQSATLRFRGV